MLDDIPIEFVLLGIVWVILQLCTNSRYSRWRGPGAGEADDAQQDHNRQFGGPKP